MEITVKQIRSSIRLSEKTILRLKSLGLGRLGKSKQLKRTPEVLGLIKKLSHLITVKGNGNEA